MRKISIIILLIICLSLLLLTGCKEIGITPEIDMGNSGNSGNQGNSGDTGTGDTEGTVDTEDTGTGDTEGTVDTEDTGTGEVDTTKPVITGSRAPLPNSFGWNNTDVTVSFSCADTGPVQSDIDINTIAGETVTTEGEDQSVTNTGVCTDVAGNTADSVTVSNINIDKTPPAVMITLPGTGEYVLNQSITAIWYATDALSGVVSPISGSVSIDTSSVGTKSFTMPAGTVIDKAGNSSLEVTISYSVIENTEGSVKWSGLEMCFEDVYDTENFDFYFDALLAAGFTQLRIGIAPFDDSGGISAAKIAVLAAVAKGFDVLWGLGSGGTILTSSNWSDYVTAVESAAAWAQANGIYEFIIGNEEEFHNDDDTLTDAQLRANLRTLATSVQAIFTNGDVTYGNSCEFLSDWLTEGRGDIDQLGWMAYLDSPSRDWKDDIDAIVATFGADHTYINEFNVGAGGYAGYSEDEEVQAAGVTEMLDYIKASGLTRAFFFVYTESVTFGYEGFEALKEDGTYRLLWSQALLNSGSVKFATVPTTTTIASLPK